MKQAEQMAFSTSTGCLNSQDRSNQIAHNSPPFPPAGNDMCRATAGREFACKADDGLV